MRTIILCILAFFLVSVSKAQSTTASLSIILTDVQSVTFNAISPGEIVPPEQEKSQKDILQILSHSTSQIKKISSRNSEYEKLYKEFYSGITSSASPSSDKGKSRLAFNRSSPTQLPKNYNTSNLVIYQIDPR